MKLSHGKLKHLILKRLSLLKESSESLGRPSAKNGNLEMHGKKYKLKGKKGYLPAASVTLQNIKLISNDSAQFTAKALGQVVTAIMPAAAVAKISSAAAKGKDFKIKTTFIDPETKKAIGTGTLIGEKI